MFVYNIFGDEIMKKVIFHIDANSAFLSWTAVDMLNKGYEKDIRTIPAVIGGNEKSRKGIVLAASAPAKKFGIKTGEPLFKAREKCPGLLTFPPDFSIYEKFSEEFYKICNNYSPALEKFSIDELFLDYTNMEMHFGNPLEGARKISEDIKNNLGFTVNIGISDNKLLAKMASDFEKPDKIHTLFPEEISDKMWHLPISDLFMVGRQTRKRLNAMGIYTIKQLAFTDDAILKYNFKSQGILLKNYANGIDLSKVKTISEPVKSISNGFTLPHDIYSKEEAYNFALSLCEKTCMRLRELNFSCNIVYVGIKHPDFSYLSHQKKLSRYVFSTNDVFKVVRFLIDDLWDEQPVRAITVSLSGFGSKGNLQKSFFDDIRSEKFEVIDSAVDKIRNKFGYYAVTRASLLNNSMNNRITKMQNPSMKSYL